MIPPEEALKIEHLVNTKASQEVAPVDNPVVTESKIGRKALLNPEQLKEFIKKVSDFHEKNGASMGWREAAKTIQEILNREAKISRTSATRYLQHAESVAEIMSQKEQLGR